MGRVKCPVCDTIYDDYFNLPVVPVDPERPELGTTRVCTKCGSKFFGNRMIMKSYVEIDGVTIEVSTADLELEHNWNGEKGYFYETMLFFTTRRDDVEIPHDEVIARYKTRDQAIKGHKIITEALKKYAKIEEIRRLALVIDYDSLEKEVAECTS